MSVNISYTGGGNRPTPNKDKYIGLVYGISAIPVGAAEKEVIEIFSASEIEDKVKVTAASTLIEDRILFYHLSTIYKINPLAVVNLYLTTTISLNDLNVFSGDVQLIGYRTGTQIADAAALTTLIGDTQAKLDQINADFNKEAVCLISVGLDNITSANLPSFETTGVAERVGYDAIQDFTEGSVAKGLFEENENLCGGIGILLGIGTKNTVRHHWGDRQFCLLNGIVQEAILSTSDQKLTTSGITKTEKEQLKNKGIMFIEKTENLYNIVLHNCRSCSKITASNNELFIARPLVKVAKIVGDTAEPLINDSSLFFEQDSTLSVASLDRIASAIRDAITQKMLAGSDKSLYELDYENGNIPILITKYEGTGNPHGIYIDPTQKVKLTKNLNVGVCLKYKDVIGLININISTFLSSAS